MYYARTPARTGGGGVEPPAELLGRFLWSWPKKASQTPKGKPLWVLLFAGDEFYLNGST